VARLPLSHHRLLLGHPHLEAPFPGKKKIIFNFLSQGLFACFNVGKHNAQEIRAHQQHVDEQLIKLETRQKALLAQHNIEHSPVCEPMDFPPPPTLYNPWEI
jgi:hypothetical protein